MALDKVLRRAKIKRRIQIYKFSKLKKWENKKQ